MSFKKNVKNALLNFEKRTMHIREHWARQMDGSTDTA